MKMVYATGGREKYYDAIKVGDCVTRAIANATGKDYKEVYDLVNSYASLERGGVRSLLLVTGYLRILLIGY